jgi:hypothetical protein
VPYSAMHVGHFLRARMMMMRLCAMLKLHTDSTLTTVSHCMFSLRRFRHAGGVGTGLWPAAVCAPC